MYTPQKAIGTFSGTAADLTVTLGFKPVSVKLINITAGASLEHIEGMADGSGFKIIGGTAPTAAYVASGCVTLTDNGFTLGTDAFNGNGETIFYVAIG